MKINSQDLKIDVSSVNITRILETWTWLIGLDKAIVMISSIGDMFLTDSNMNYYWLNVGEGTLEKVADNTSEFNHKLKNQEQINEWFLIDLLKELKKKNITLSKNQLYGYNVLPVLGGNYDVENLVPTDIEVHFELWGEVHRQIKDLPDGTTINISLKE